MRRFLLTGYDYLKFIQTPLRRKKKLRIRKCAFTDFKVVIFRTENLNKLRMKYQFYPKSTKEIAITNKRRQEFNYFNSHYERC